QVEDDHNPGTNRDKGVALQAFEAEALDQSWSVRAQCCGRGDAAQTDQHVRPDPPVGQDAAQLAHGYALVLALFTCVVKKYSLLQDVCFPLGEGAYAEEGFWRRRVFRDKGDKKH